jgi:hypothetical protein
VYFNTASPHKGEPKILWGPGNENSIIIGLVKSCILSGLFFPVRPSQHSVKKGETDGGGAYRSVFVYAHGMGEFYPKNLDPER